MKKNWTQKYKIVYDYFCSVAVNKGTKPTVRGFCAFLAISTGKNQNWSQGQWPSAEDLETIHDKLGFTYGWLVTGEGEPFEENFLPSLTPNDAGELDNLRHEVSDLKEELIRTYQDNARLSRELIAISEERRKLTERLEQSECDSGERPDSIDRAANV